MLGLVWVLAATTTDAPAIVGATLAAGWLIQPALLWFSLRHPRARYGLIVPSSLVGAALLALVVWWLPDSRIAAAGWFALTAGILLGGLLGGWLWYRWVPVPQPLRDPFAPSRWALVAVHAGLVAVGLLLVTASIFL
jgi:hypothetical protein